MYYRISGAQFTIRSAEEKKDFIDIINKDKNFSNHLVCRGINAEQFTGKVNGAVVCEKDNPNKVYIFSCEGNFPTLKLYQRTSSVVYIIEFPVSKEGQIVLEKEPEPAVEEEPKPIEPEQKQEEQVVEPEKPVVETEPDFIVAKPQPDPFENPLFSEFVVESEEESPINEESENQEEPVQEEQPVKKKRGRRKKS